jgi:hypothetical protein
VGNALVAEGDEMLDSQTGPASVIDGNGVHTIDPTTGNKDRDVCRKVADLVRWKPGRGEDQTIHTAPKKPVDGPPLDRWV